MAASSVSDLKSKQNDVEKQIDQKKEDLENVQQQKAATLQDLDSLEEQIDKVQEEVNQLTNDLAEAQSDYETQQAELKIIEDKLAESQATMRERVQSIYVNGDVSYLDVIFNASSVDEFLSNFVFLEKIVEQDKSIIDTIEENQRLAKEKLAELQATKDKIASLKSNKEAQETQIASQQQEKAAMVSELKNSEDGLQAIISEFKQESASIESQIQAVYAQQAAAKKQQSASKNAGSGSADSKNSGSGSDSSGGGSYSGGGYTGSGKLGWPLSIHGTFSSPYGYRGSEFHTGQDLAAGYGTPVLAAESGTVILVKYLTTSYGHYVVIDHGGSLTTLYAHMSTINVSVGDSVSRGQQIGGVGSTGRSTGNHLHFEVRVNGSPVNPLNYI